MSNIRSATPADWPFWHSLDARIPRELFLSKAEAGECYIVEWNGAPAGLLRWNRFWVEVPFCTLLHRTEAARSGARPGAGGALGGGHARDGPRHVHDIHPVGRGRPAFLAGAGLQGRRQL